MDTDITSLKTILYKIKYKRHQYSDCLLQKLVYGDIGFYIGQDIECKCNSCKIGIYHCFEIIGGIDMNEYLK